MCEAGELSGHAVARFRPAWGAAGGYLFPRNVSDPTYSEKLRWLFDKPASGSGESGS